MAMPGGSPRCRRTKGVTQQCAPHGSFCWGGGKCYCGALQRNRASQRRENTTYKTLVSKILKTRRYDREAERPPCQWCKDKTWMQSRMQRPWLREMELWYPFEEQLNAVCRPTCGQDNRRGYIPILFFKGNVFKNQLHLEKLMKGHSI